jgi:hypothetical protein
MERLTQTFTGWAGRVRNLDGRDAMVAMVVLLVPGASVPYLVFLAWQRYRQTRPTQAAAEQGSSSA